MQRLMLAVCAVLTIASVFGAAGAATAALTVTIVQPATNPSSAEVDETVAFEAVAFNDGQELEYANVQWLWQFGDATQSTNNPTSHAYVAAGDYTVTVTATFNQAQASATTHVIVEDDEETPKITGFDSSLSIYVGFRGHWINYASGESEFAEIEAPVAVFQPGEQVTDDFETWFSHQINAPRPPSGWCFFSVDAGETMQMHVIVRDTQNRLGDVVVTNRDSGAQIGTLDANSAGSQIDGYLDISSAGDVFTLSVRDKAAGNVICLAATNSPRVEDARLFVFHYPWNPNRGEKHDCPIVDLIGPYGYPKDVTGKKALHEGPGIGGNACVGPRYFTNDTSNSLAISPPAGQELENKVILREIGLPAGVSGAVIDLIQAKIDKLREPYTGGANCLPELTVPPYSKGVGHWPLTLSGDVAALVCIPVGGVVKWDDKWDIKLEAGFTEADGEDTDQSAVKLAVGYQYGQVDGEKWPIGAPIPVGNQYALVVDSVGTPQASPLEGITTPVTFTLMADKARYVETGGLIGGSATLERLDAFTTPAPPVFPGGGEYPRTLQFPMDEEDPLFGTCVTELQKGFKYKVTYVGDGRYVGGDPVEFEVPPTSAKQINVGLHILQCLAVVAVRGGEAVEAYVEVRNPSGSLAFYGDTSADADGRQVFTCLELSPSGQWSCRAKPKGAGDDKYGDWYSFAVTYSWGTQETTVQVGGP